MRPARGRTDDAALVAAAQAGDAQALADLVAACLPLAYGIVGRALGGLSDVDDVVQETMLCVLRDLRTLRNPDSFRPWLVTIATRQVGTHLRRRRAAERTATLDEAVDAQETGFEGLVLLRLELSGQRRQAVRASRWLDPDDRAVLSLWWLETAGWLTRTELAVALGLGAAHATVRVHRMRIQLELCRSLVAALEATPRCGRLTAASTGWDGVPRPLWRKRLARHTRSCPVCRRAADGLVPPERLLADLVLTPVPVAVLDEGTLAGTAAGVSPTGGPPGAGGSPVARGIIQTDNRRDIHVQPYHRTDKVSPTAAAAGRTPTGTDPTEVSPGIDALLLNARARSGNLRSIDTSRSRDPAGVRARPGMLALTRSPPAGGTDRHQR